MARLMPATRLAPRAVLLDALGTLVELDDPVGGLVRELGALGVGLDPAQARRALRAEIAYYRANHDQAVDEPTLEDLRDRCAAVLRDELPPAAAELAFGDLREALLRALRFRVFDEVPLVLEALRAHGAALVVVSNWDVSLRGVLAETGLAPMFDAVLTSAEEGVAKPDRRIFERALALAGGVNPWDALHCGDDPVADVEGARAAGIAPVLVDRDGALEAPPGVCAVRSLAELLPAPR